MHTKLLTAAVGGGARRADRPGSAEFALGEETKGVTVKFGEEADLKVRVRLQPRYDAPGICTPTPTASVSFHLGGLTAQAEYIHFDNETTGQPKVEAKGWYVQAGYFIPGANIEPAIRYEKYNHDDNATTDREDKITTVGFNGYFKGHSMKLGQRREQRDHPGQSPARWR